MADQTPKETALAGLVDQFFGAPPEPVEHGLVDPFAAVIRAGAVEPGLVSPDPKRRAEALRSLEQRHAEAEAARRAASERTPEPGIERDIDELLAAQSALEEIISDEDVPFAELLASEDLPAEDRLPDGWEA